MINHESLSPDNQSLQLIPFTESDIEPVTPIMKRAFDEDSRRHLDGAEGGPPGYDNGDFLRKWALHPDSTSFTIRLEGKLVGAVVVWINGNGENFLGNIFIDPDYQDKGLGLKVWRLIERTFPDTKIWRTETPGFSRRNHHFYVNRCGFKIVRIENPKDPLESSYQMEKVMK